MKFTAHEFVARRESIGQLLSAADAHGGNWIDCQGYGEALLTLSTGQFGGTTPGVAVKWREADDDPANPGTPLTSSIADIAGAVFQTVTLVPDAIVASVLPSASLACTIAGQPPTKGARITATLTSSTITSLVLTIVGTRPALTFPELVGQYPLTAGSQPATVVATLSAATGWSTGVSFDISGIFDTITSVTIGAIGGSIGSDTITVGYDNSGPKCPQVGRLNLFARKRYIQAHSTKAGSAQTGGFTAGAALLASGMIPVPQVLDTVFNVT